MNCSFFLPFVYAFLQLSCATDGLDSKNKQAHTVVQYDFPNQETCSMMLEEQCFSSPEDYAFYTGSEVESLGLNLVEIDLETEKEIGAKFHEGNQFVEVDDERLPTLNRILGKMKPHILRNEIPYKVFVVQSSDINAWTVPGGYIYFTTGILNFAKNEDELANILGHEIGHNECKHTHKYIQRAALANMPMQIFGFEADASFFVDIYNSIVVAFGQHEELESDRTGFRLAALAGYDPSIGLEFWKRMAETEQKNRFQKFFRSHPFSDERFDCGSDYIRRHSKTW